VSVFFDHIVRPFAYIALGTTNTMSTRPKRKIIKSHEQKDTSESLRAVRGKRGLLEILPNLPLDIVYEVLYSGGVLSFCESNVPIQQILSQCSPLNLQLARTTKAFRALLMSQFSIAIWRSAHQLPSDKQVMGMPECPPYLSEPAYANLAFDPHCHVRITGYGSSANFFMLHLRIVLPITSIESCGSFANAIVPNAMGS